MIRQSQGKIFLADERGITENENFRKISTFNFGEYQRPHKEAFGKLITLNECTLGAKQTVSSELTRLTGVLIIPIVGGIEVDFENSVASYIEAGSVQGFTRLSGDQYLIRNPFENELVKYLELHLAVLVSSEPRYAEFDLDLNNLVDLLQNEEFDNDYRIQMIKLKGRQEEIYRLSNPNQSLFFYVLQGACEIEYRLLHAGDGLALWSLLDTEMEALSEDVIILIVEMPMK